MLNSNTNTNTNHSDDSDEENEAKINIRLKKIENIEQTSDKEERLKSFSNRDSGKENKHLDLNSQLNSYLACGSSRDVRISAPKESKE